MGGASSAGPENERRTSVKSRVVVLATVALLVYGLAHCSFGPEPYGGPWPDETESGDDGGTVDDGAPDGGGH